MSSNEVYVYERLNRLHESIKEKYERISELNAICNNQKMKIEKLKADRISSTVLANIRLEISKIQAKNASILSNREKLLSQNKLMEDEIAKNKNLVKETILELKKKTFVVENALLKMLHRQNQLEGSLGLLRERCSMSMEDFYSLCYQLPQLEFDTKLRNQLEWKKRRLNSTLLQRKQADTLLQQLESEHTTLTMKLDTRKQNRSYSRF